jgi:extracellular factor (EF) 3-hydroxypalmitic acid methyl ester biosynthesis protein
MNRSFHPRAHPYRPQRYHAWDVFETAPRVMFLQAGSDTQTFSLINFSEEGLCFEYKEKLDIKVGDLLCSLHVVFGHQTLLTSDAKIKHVTFHPASQCWQYGLRFLDSKLNISEVFALRNQFQNRSVMERLRRIQRSPRYGRELLDQLEIQASLEWEGKKFPIQIENVSEFGFYFSLDGLSHVEVFATSFFQPDIILEKFYFSVDGKPLFEGRVRIVHVKKENFRLEVGVFCLDGSSVFLSGFETALKLREIKKEFLLFWQKTDISQKIHPEFKAALNDFRYFLESMKSYLERAEADIQRLSNSQERESALKAVMNFSERMLAERVRNLIKEIEKIVLKLTEEEDEIHRKYFQEQMLELTNGCLAFRRAFEKPLGYPGDYEIMNSLYHRTKEGNNLWERLMSSCLNEHMEGPQAVRNRARYLESKIAQTVAKNSDQKTIRILSLACGPCEEIQRFFRAESGERKAAIHFYLLDQEEQALAYAQKCLYPLTSQVSSEKGRVTFDFLQQGVKHLLKNSELVSSYPKMNLIYSAGLFDYLPAPIAKQLTKVLLSMLSEEGLLVIGNFNQYYPAKFLIQYISDWFLIHRSSEELLNFLPDDSWHSHATVEQEDTGSTLFLNARKPSGEMGPANG